GRATVRRSRRGHRLHPHELPKWRGLPKQVGPGMDGTACETAGSPRSWSVSVDRESPTAVIVPLGPAIEGEIRGVSAPGPPLTGARAERPRPTPARAVATSAPRGRPSTPRRAAPPPARGATPPRPPGAPRGPWRGRRGPGPPAPAGRGARCAVRVARAPREDAA